MTYYDTLIIDHPDLPSACIGSLRIAWAHEPYSRGGYAHILPGAAAARPLLA